MNDDAAVFRGVVLDRKMLPVRADMRGRNRYVIEFKVDEYWKGTPSRTLSIYGMDSGTDCMGDGGHEIGKEYLVYARQQEAKDVHLDEETLWFGWLDVVAEGSSMLVPDTACKPGGEVTAVKVKKALRQLGKGKIPPQVPSL
jgi:hypothetical protein